MQYLGGKLSAAQLQVAGWVGSVRRSLQGALELVWGNSEEKQQEEQEEEDENEEEEGEEGGDGGGRFQRAMSPLRSFARRSRRSLRRFSVRSRRTLQRRTTETCSVRADVVDQTLWDVYHIQVKSEKQTQSKITLVALKGLAMLPYIGCSDA